MTNTLIDNFEVVIGLEVHLQLNTKTKIFCGCKNDFGREPNSLTCPVCLGLPGSLPVLNKKALEHGIKVGLALNCEINPYIKFDRKNYYYPDLPKAYQISQYDMPVAKNGYIMIPTENETYKRINITRAHLEEDAGKLIHDDESNCSLADYNRTGTPLIEIVSEPDLRSAQEAYDYLQTLKLILSYLDVSDCDMEKGSLRCDANISIRQFGDTKLGTKTELKNMNSFKAVKAALEYEINRHKSVVISGGKIIQQTLLWDENKQSTHAMRSKEDAHDYRYFPEPDLVPFIVEKDQIELIKSSIDELPSEKINRFKSSYDVSDYDAKILVSDKHLANFFEETVKHFKNTKKVCNWINSNLLKELNERKTTINNLTISPGNLSKLINNVENGTISNLAAKELLRIIVDTNEDVDKLIKDKGLAQQSDSFELEKIVDQLITDNPKVVDEIKNGNQKGIGFLVGQAMKKTQGKSNPKLINEIITRRLFNE